MGDELMAAGQARLLHQKTGAVVVITDPRGRMRTHELWTGVPYIVTKHSNAAMPRRLLNAPGFRPYIAGKTLERWTWRPFVPTPAEIVFTPEEKAFAEPYRGMVMIEPNVKNIGHDNKAWIPARWAEVAYALDDDLKQRPVQCGPADQLGRLLAAGHVPTPTFRHAAAVLSVCRAYIGTEGGLHHAAAAVGTPSVILWSEFIAPEITGYKTMTNLRHAGKPCGNRMRCAGCRKSMEAITVDEVVQALERILK